MGSHAPGCPCCSCLEDRLIRVAEWYESGPKYPREFEEGRQQIAKDIRAILAWTNRQVS